MSAGAVGRLRGALRAHLFPRRHTALLVMIVALFSVRVLIGDTPLTTALFSITLLAVLLLALYTVQIDDLVGDRTALGAERRRRRILAWVLACIAIGERLAVMVWPDRRLLGVSLACWLLFMAFVTWGQLRSLLRQRTVTGETLSMSISVYLLLGFCWALVYTLIYRRHPGAFGFGSPEEDAAMAAADYQTVLPIFAYFSLVTLSTVGYGHIYPLHLHARYAAVAEAITGQLYLAILVARLVALQMSPPNRQDR